MDVSALVALLIDEHQANDRISRWADGSELAVCPISELGFLRVTGQVFGTPQDQARRVLKDFYEHDRPQFIPCDLAVLEGAKAAQPSETTDLYLASLAGRHGMKLATLDGRIKHPAAYLVPN